MHVVRGSTMKKLWIGIIIVVVVLAIVFVVTKTKKESEEIKIGAILPLTGGAALYGEALKNGIELAVEQINTKSGIRGRKISVIYEDDANLPNNGVSAVRKMLETEKVSVIIGGAGSSVAMAIAPIANKQRVILLSPTATAPALTQSGKYFFRIWPSDNYDGSYMAKFAFEKLGLRKVSILYVNNDYGLGIEQVFKTEFKKLGGGILNSESYDLGTTDFRTQLTKIKGNNPEAIYLPGYFKEFTIILRQIRELGIKARILSVNSFYDPKLLEIAGKAAEGAIFTYPTYDPKSKDPIIQEFVKAFQAKYGKEPDAFAVQGYDCMKIIAYAIEKGGYSADGIQKAMAQIKDFPAIGGRTTFDENGDVIKPLRILTVKNGKFVPFENQFL